MGFTNKAFVRLRRRRDILVHQRPRLQLVGRLQLVPLAMCPPCSVRAVLPVRRLRRPIPVERRAPHRRRVAGLDEIQVLLLSFDIWIHLLVISAGYRASGSAGGGGDKPKAQRDHAKALSDIEKKGTREKRSFESFLLVFVFSSFRKVEKDHQRLEKEWARYWKEVERKVRDADRKQEQHNRQVERDTRDNEKDMDNLKETIAKKEAVREEREQQMLERFEERITSRVEQLNSRRDNKFSRWTSKTDKRRLRNDLLQAKRVVRLKHREVEKIKRKKEEEVAEMDRRRRRREHFLFGYQSHWDEKKIYEAQGPPLSRIFLIPLTLPEVQKLNPWKPPPKREVERFVFVVTLLLLSHVEKTFPPRRQSSGRQYRRGCWQVGEEAARGVWLR